MFFTSGLVSVPELLSLSSDVLASEEVDCYKAYEVGSILLSNYQCMKYSYSEVKFKESGCIKNMILTHCIVAKIWSFVLPELLNTWTRLFISGLRTSLKVRIWPFLKKADVVSQQLAACKNKILCFSSGLLL